MIIDTTATTTLVALQIHYREREMSAPKCLTIHDLQCPHRSLHVSLLVQNPVSFAIAIFLMSQEQAKRSYYLGVAVLQIARKREVRIARGRERRYIP